jgi:hypothetical protein
MIDEMTVNRDECQLRGRQKSACRSWLRLMVVAMQATTICAFLCGTEHANVDVPVVYRRQFDLAEEMQAIR